MKINELIAEQQTIEEGIGSFLGKAAGHVKGGLGAAWRDAKQGYKDAKAVWDPKDPPGTYNNDPATNGAAPASGPNPDELRKQAAELTKQADQIEKSVSQPAPATSPLSQAERDAHRAAGGKFDNQTGQMIPLPTTPPAGQSLDLDQLKQQSAAKQADSQAAQQQAQQQMAATQQANAATNQQDAAIKAAADAAKAKPAFQQTAADKLAIKAAADKGIKEAKEKKLKKKKKIVAEFHSNFLGKRI